MKKRLSKILLSVVLLYLSAHHFAVDVQGASGAFESRVRWTAKLDGDIEFYRTSELAVLLVATKKSLYAIDSATGEVVWRRGVRGRLDETDVANVPGTDLLLLSLAEGNEKSRLEAVDVLSGESIWRTDKVRGGVMALAIDLEARLLAVVLARDARGRADANVKRRAEVRTLDLGTGRELWKGTTKSEIEMMPARFASDKQVAFTFDNYRAPVFADGKLFLFYEGVTTFDAREGGERRREDFKVNEAGLALTEAETLFDEAKIYATGRGRVRALSRADNSTVWQSDDFGITPEMLQLGNRIIVRTGGSFTRLRDGETVERSPFGVSAIDARDGKTMWRFKGADKGITNLAVLDAGGATIAVADRDDVIWLDARSGKPNLKIKHKIERAAFLLINEANALVVGGASELAAFDATSGRELWRAKYTPPARGAWRIAGAIAARAASIYFRYGAVATTAVRGARLARSLNGLRSLSVTGLAQRFAVTDLTTLATGVAREQITARFAPFGIASQIRNAADTARGVSLNRALVLTGKSVDVEERLLDRLDPAQGLERLSNFLLRRERLAALNGRFMYFYTNLNRLERHTEETSDGRGLAGVNVNNGRTERVIPTPELDTRFTVDEASALLFTAKDNRLFAYEVGNQ